MTTLSPENEAAEIAVKYKDCKKSPIILIPGVTGDGMDYQKIARALNKLLPDQPVFLWYDPRHPQFNKGSKANISKLSISEQAQLLQEQIKRFYPEGPYNIIGYSFGANVAYELTQKIEADNQNVNLLIIDAPAPELSKQHLVADNNKATADFVAILNYAARISGLKEIILTEAHLTKLSHFPIRKQLAFIHSLILEVDENHEAMVTKTSAFYMFFRIIEENLTALCNYTPALKPVDNLTLLTTKETLNKYECKPDEGWASKAKTFVSNTFGDDKITHTSLLKGDDAILVARHINQFLKKTNAPVVTPIASVVSPLSTSILTPVTDSSKSASGSPQRSQDDCRTPSPPTSPMSPDPAMDRMLKIQLEQLEKSTSSLFRHRMQKTDFCSDIGEVKLDSPQKPSFFMASPIGKKPGINIFHEDRLTSAVYRK